MAEQVAEVFTEVVLAPGFEDGAVELLSRKPSIRLLVVPPSPPQAVEWRPISGGMLLQVRDRLDAPGDDPAAWTLQTGEALRRAARRPGLRLARGARGQEQRHPARVRRRDGRRRHGTGEPGGRGPARRRAGGGAGRRLGGGVRRVLPVRRRAAGAARRRGPRRRAAGGSVRDAEVVAAAEAAGATVYFTGTRHFAH
jgi:phosphoribosylaminoimidazolecarboxamide formyltransferase/IMP cyclohydrolase